MPHLPDGHSIPADTQNARANTEILLEVPPNNLAKTPDVQILNDSVSTTKVLQDDRFMPESRLLGTGHF